MDNLTMPVKAIKNIMGRECEEIYNGAARAVRERVLSDMGRNLVSQGYEKLREELHRAETYEELDTFCGDWYGISLQEWVNSL